MSQAPTMTTHQGSDGGMQAGVRGSGAAARKRGATAAGNGGGRDVKRRRAAGKHRVRDRARAGGPACCAAGAAPAQRHGDLVLCERVFYVTVSVSEHFGVSIHVLQLSGSTIL